MASGDSGDSPSKAATAAMGRGCKGLLASSLLSKASDDG